MKKFLLLISTLAFTASAAPVNKQPFTQKAKQFTRENYDWMIGLGAGISLIIGSHFYSKGVTSYYDDYRHFEGVAGDRAPSESGVNLVIGKPTSDAMTERHSFWWRFFLTPSGSKFWNLPLVAGLLITGISVFKGINTLTADWKKPKKLSPLHKQVD